jgi:hypothetical protein
VTWSAKKLWGSTSILNLWQQPTKFYFISARNTRGKSLIFALFELACSFQKQFYYLQRSDLFSGRQTFFMHVLLACVQNIRQFTPCKKERKAFNRGQSTAQEFITPPFDFNDENFCK